MDDYGKLFSIIENVAKWFPKLSGFTAGRESSVQLFDIYKVFNIKADRVFLKYESFLSVRAIGFFFILENC